MLIYLYLTAYSLEKRKNSTSEECCSNALHVEIKGKANIYFKSRQNYGDYQKLNHWINILSYLRI